MTNIIDSQIQPGSARATTRGPLFVDVCGIAMFLPDMFKVVVVDARKPRVAVTDGSLIAPHMPLVGIEAGTYLPPVTSKEEVASDAVVNDPLESLDVLGNVSFDYDLDGHGVPLRFDAFMLDGHTVRFRDVLDRQPTPGGRRFGSMKMLAPDLELCTAVRSGGSRQVVGTVDFSNARSVEGKAHGRHDGPLTFGHNIVDCADMAIAAFEVGDEQPYIELQKGSMVTKIVLKGDGPWRVMVGNFPVDELVGNQQVGELRTDVPLTHLELYYDLYHVGKFDPVLVPRGDSHIHARTANGRCGPTLTP